MGVPYDLTCWYLNARRIVELTGVVLPYSHDHANDDSADFAKLRNLKEAVVAWMATNAPLPLEVQLTKDKCRTGSLFTHHSNFYFKGLSKVAEARRKGKPVNPAQAYSRLDEWQSGARVLFEFHDDHLTSNSSWSELTGQKRAFVLGLVTDIPGSVIKAVPYVIANLADPSSTLVGFAGVWGQHLEVQVDQIDTFNAVIKIQDRPKQSDLKQLREISESQVKSAFAEIIGEPTVPKDWAGESSDLFTSRLVIDGQRISTAFLLKGPAKFHPMTPADLGKNGDQIGRLFDEPADLLVLQHCHEVKPAVRKQMRAYAQQMSRPRQFCIIDGYDTLCILQAYRKCGLASA